MILYRSYIILYMFNVFILYIMTFETFHLPRTSRLSWIMRLLKRPIRRSPDMSQPLSLSSHPIVRSMVDIMKPRFIGVLPAVAT